MFEEWADKLLADGITAINGRIVGGRTGIRPAAARRGWAWDYLAASYAAGVSALQFNESMAEVAIRPAAAVGAPALIEVRPIESGLILDKQVTTVADGQPDIELLRLPDRIAWSCTGQGPDGLTRGGEDGHRGPAGALLRPDAARDAAREGHPREGRGGRVRGRLPGPASGAGARPVVAPFGSAVGVRAGADEGQPEPVRRDAAAHARRTRGRAPAEAGHKVVREVLDGWGVAPDAYILVDGSGLSRYNYLSAEMLVKILRQIYRDPRHRDPFMATLPIAGQDGTIARRFVGTRAAGNVRAKTGSIANTRALSGYVTTADGETLVFSVLANSFSQPSSVIDSATDLAIERLANFTRTPAASNPSTR